MSAKSVCDLSCGAMHEFALALDKAGFDADLVQKITNSRGNKLAKAMLGTLGNVTEPPLLISRGTATIGPPTEPFDPHEFFQTRAGLFVSDEFKARVLKTAQKVNKALAIEVAHFDLARPAQDSAIIAALPQGKPEVALWAIGQMIKTQAGGQAGHLLNNGSANLFYFGDSVVNVRWDAGRRRWDVNAWPLVDDGWYEGDRTFSCN